MHRHSEHPASGTLSPTGNQWLPIWKPYLMIKAVDLSRITGSRAISRPWRKRDAVSTVLVQVHPSQIGILFDIVAMEKERALALYSPWIRRGIEILIANANQSVNVPATRLHCLTLFIVRLELAQDRLHCVLPLKQQQKKPVKHRNTSFRSTRGSLPVSFPISAASRCSPFLNSRQMEGYSVFSCSHRLTSLAYQLLCSSYCVKWTVGLGHISSWQVSTPKILF